MTSVLFSRCNMSARKVTAPGGLSAKAAGFSTRIDLTASEVHIRKNGMEFRSLHAIPVWTEMTVALETPWESHKVEFNGVVVACNGNRHTGYTAAMLFTGLSRQAQAQLAALALSA